jgi:type I restriction enzyme, S subunit
MMEAMQMDLDLGGGGEVKTVALGKLTSLVSSGSTPLGGAKIYLDQGPVMLIRSQNVLMRELSLDDVAFITDDVAGKMQRTVVQPNDVLLNITGASIGRVSTFELSCQANVNQHVCIIRVIPELLSHRYLMHFLAQPSFQAHIDSSQHGGTRQALTFPQIRDFQIPLPPLTEQKRIAAILDKADRIRQKRKETIRLTEELLRSAFLEMFGDPVTNPKGWEVQPLNNVIRRIQAGWCAKGEERPFENDEWGVLKISAVTSGRFKSAEHKAVKFSDLVKTPIVPQKGDLLISRANTRELVAATCLVEEDCERVFLPDKLWKIHPDPMIANVEYLRFLLADPQYRQSITKKATGTSGSMLNISQKKLIEMDAPIPPLMIQQQFAQSVWKIFHLRQQKELAASQSENLFNALLQRAFKGQL